MSVLWMTSLRPIGKSIENDKIQEEDDLEDVL